GTDGVPAATTATAARPRRSGAGFRKFWQGARRVGERARRAKRRRAGRAAAATTSAARGRRRACRAGAARAAHGAASGLEAEASFAERHEAYALGPFRSRP